MSPLMCRHSTTEQRLNDRLVRAISISTQRGVQEFIDTVSAILYFNRNLDTELKSNALAKLRNTCGHYRIVPTSYILTGVRKDGHLPQKVGITTETWRGYYRTKAVAIKMFKEHRDHDKIKVRFCKEAVLWLRLAHENVLPFWGVSSDFGEFCWISPWMNNGTIMEHIRDNPQINPLELLKDVANGLDFLHSNHLVHGDLRAEHILIGNNGQARIANAGYSEIVPTTFTTSETPLSSMALDEFEWRWSAPELQKPGMYGMRRAIATKASDIYGMGMVIYEESPWNRLVLLRCLTPAQVLTREVPFSGYTDREALVKAQGGDRPRRPANTTSPGITDSIWMLLGQCWYRKPDYRPDSAHVLNIIRHYCLFWEHKPPNPWQIWLKMSNIVTDWKTMRSINPYVTLQYRGSDHTTSRAAAAGRNKYVWEEYEHWSIELRGWYDHQIAIVQLFHRGSLPFRRRELLGTGKLFLSLTSMATYAEIDGQLAEGLNGARVNMEIMQ